MEEFRVEKSTVPVTLRLRDGQELRGRVFLPMEPRDEPFVGRLEQLLNGSDPFLPIELGPIELGEDRTTVVQNKDRVMWCRYDGPPGPVVEILLPRRRVTLLLADGSSLVGDLVVSGPHNRRRVLDCLNLSPSFLLVEARDADYLVCRDAISLVPSAEEGDAREEASFEVEEAVGAS